MARKTKPAVAETLIQQMVDGEPAQQWAVISGHDVASWTADPQAATRLTYSAALKFQIENEKRPDATYLHICLDTLTLSTGPVEYEEGRPDGDHF
jgi:hypothetical protein